MYFDINSSPKFLSPLHRPQTGANLAPDNSGLLNSGKQLPSQDSFSKCSEMPTGHPSEVTHKIPAELNPLKVKEFNYSSPTEVPTVKPAEVESFKPLEVPSMRPMGVKSFSSLEIQITTPMEVPIISVEEMPPMKGATVQVFTPLEMPQHFPIEVPPLETNFSKHSNAYPAILSMDPTNLS